jgi:chemotaxis protein methyltransferase CheR
MNAPAARNESLEEIEIELLLEGMFRHYGFDFRNYAPASLKRRVRECMHDEGVATISGYQEKILHDRMCLDRLLTALSVNVTAMFRDPTFYRTFRERVIPTLRTYPFVRLWHAGCSTGEEVYSMAILLKEEGLYDRCRIYATDMSLEALKRAREAIFPLASMQEYTANYMRSGGKRFFSDYYTAQYDNVIFDSSLRANVVFSEHNLVTDGSFNEFHVVLCRNVMIYFNKSLQERVHSLIFDSLVTFGVLGLGNKESLRFTPWENSYEALNEADRLYRKVA